MILQNFIGRVVVVSTAIFGLFFVGSAFAQRCPDYTAANREYIQKVLLHVTPKIERLNELAVQSNALRLMPRSQRAAMNAEFRLWTSYITRLGDSAHPVSDKSKLFLNTVVDKDFLGLTGAGVDGANVAEAESNTYQAMRKSFDALSKLWSCY
jgi:hypothetical protein